MLVGLGYTRRIRYGVTAYQFPYLLLNLSPILISYMLIMLCLSFFLHTEDTNEETHSVCVVNDGAIMR